MKKIAFVIALTLIFTVNFCSCNSSQKSSENKTTSTEKEIYMNFNEKAVKNIGNLDKLFSAMNKAKNGEKITVGVIGGSITQGSSALLYENCYANRFKNWWINKFPDTEIEFVNAGIGGTDSYLGVHRVDEQLLSASPDVVITEFAVNDSDPTFHKNSYDSLVRKILSSEKNPAVILLFTTMENGFSMQETHLEIGKAYDLPCISYRDVILDRINSGEFAWADISPDDIHPNDKGHEIIGEILYEFLDEVYVQSENYSGTPSEFDSAPVTKDFYSEAKLVSASETSTEKMDGFEIADNSVYPIFADNFVTDSNGEITFKLNDCKTFGIFYLKMVDGSLGQYDVFVDDKYVKTLDGNFFMGWGNYGVGTEIFANDFAGNYTVTLKPSAGNTNKGFVILRLMVG